MSDPKGLRVRVDRDKCQGHNRCKAAGAGAVRARRVRQRARGRRRHGAARLEDKAYLAKSNCPEFAVEIIEK